MSPRIITCEQGTPEWHAARAGIPTASEFSTVLAKGRGGGESITRRKYLLTLLGERLTGEVLEGYTNAHMERGHAMEDDARRMYAMMRDVDPECVGFMRRDEYEAGASPDSLIGDVGMLEIKTKLPHLHLDVIESGEVPAEHMTQIQGQLWIAGREWVDFVSYWPRLELFVKRVYRDEKRIVEIARGVYDFVQELHEREDAYRARNGMTARIAIAA